LWGFLSTERRSGQLHSIEDHLPCRQKGNTSVLCPVCPEKGINLEDRYQTTPEGFEFISSLLLIWLLILTSLARHLHQQHHGNYLASHQVKNCSRKDVSLYKGDTYYPKQEAYKSTVASASKPGQEVCDSLNGL
jgi:hypothetical protein